MPDLEILKSQFKDHCESETKRFDTMEDNLINIRGDVKNIKDNHLAHVQSDVAEMKIDVGVMKNDLTWLKKNHWVVFSASVGTFLSLVVGLIILLIRMN